MNDALTFTIPAELSDGFELPMHRAGLRPTSAPGRFGAHRYIVRRNGVAVQFLVSPIRATKNTIEAPTDEHRAIVAELVSMGIARIAP